MLFTAVRKSGFTDRQWNKLTIIDIKNITDSFSILQGNTNNNTKITPLNSLAFHPFFQRDTFGLFLEEY